jgi:hypothetical protein
MATQFQQPYPGPQGGQPQGQQAQHPTLPDNGQQFSQPQLQSRQVSTDNLPPAPQRQQQTFASQPGTAPYQQPQQPQQQQQQLPYNPPQPQQASQGGQFDPNVIVDGPNVPPELRGRRMGQVMQIYTALADDWMRRNQHQQSGGSLAPQPQRQEPQGQPYQQPQQQQAPQPQRNQQGQYQQQAQQPQQRQQDVDWRQEIRQIVSEVVAPVTQSNQASQVQQAREMARMAVPDFGDLEADVMQMLSGVDPSGLTNPQVWEGAADMVRGRKIRAGQYNPQAAQQPQQVQNGMTGYQHPGARPAVPANQSPIPQYQFFTEGPSAPQLQGPSGMLTPQERSYAQKMGMSDQDYIAWRGGVVR